MNERMKQITDKINAYTSSMDESFVPSVCVLFIMENFQSLFEMLTKTHSRTLSFKYLPKVWV